MATIEIEVRIKGKDHEEFVGDLVAEGKLEVPDDINSSALAATAARAVALLLGEVAGGLRNRGTLERMVETFREASRDAGAFQRGPLDPQAGSAYGEPIAPQAREDADSEAALQAFGHRRPDPQPDASAGDDWDGVTAPTEAKS